MESGSGEFDQELTSTSSSGMPVQHFVDCYHFNMVAERRLCTSTENCQAKAPSWNDLAGMPKGFCVHDPDNGIVTSPQVQVMGVNVSILVMSERCPPSTIHACDAATHRPTIIQLPSSATSLRIPATRSVFSSYCCWGCLGRIADRL